MFGFDPKIEKLFLRDDNFENQSFLVFPKNQGVIFPSS